MSQIGTMFRLRKWVDYPGDPGNTKLTWECENKKMVVLMLHCGHEDLRNPKTTVGDIRKVLNATLEAAKDFPDDHPFWREPEWESGS